MEKVHKYKNQKNLPRIKFFDKISLDKKIQKMTNKSLRNKVKDDLKKAKEYAISNREKFRKRKVPESVSVSAKISASKKDEIASFLKKSKASFRKRKVRKIPTGRIGDEDFLTKRDSQEITFRDIRRKERKVREVLYSPGLTLIRFGMMLRSSV